MDKKITICSYIKWIPYWSPDIYKENILVEKKKVSSLGLWNQRPLKLKCKTFIYLSWDNYIHLDSKKNSNFYSLYRERAFPGSEFVVANMLAKWKKLEPNETGFKKPRF